jgi:hypothetical protein
VLIVFLRQKYLNELMGFIYFEESNHTFLWMFIGSHYFQFNQVGGISLRVARLNNAQSL